MKKEILLQIIQLGDVYCFVIAKNDVKEVKTGSLNNIALTVLKLMNLNIPSEMDEPLK